MTGIIGPTPPVVAAAVLVAFVFLYRFFMGKRRDVLWADLAMLFFLALGVRAVAAVGVEIWLRTATGTPFLFGTLGDDFRYHAAATDLARRWSVGGFQLPPVLYTRGYDMALALVYWVMTPSVWLGKLSNVVVGAAVAPMVYRLVRDLDASESAWRAGLLTALFPPLVFWSTLLYKDTLLTLALVAVLTSGLRFLTGGGSALVAFLAGSVGILVVGALRLQTVVLAAVALSVSALAHPVRTGRHRRPRNIARVLLPVVAVLAGVYVFSSRLFAISGPGVLQYIGLDRIDIYYEARSLAFSTTSSGIESTFLSLPIQFVSAFALPLPLFVDTKSVWNATEQAMLGGNFVWLWLLYFAFSAMVRGNRRELMNWLPVIAIVVGTGASIAVRGYAMIYRHKMQMYPFVIVLAALAMSRLESGAWKRERLPRWLWGLGLGGIIVVYNYLRISIVAR